MASNVNRIHQTKRGLRSFDDVGWSAISVASLVVAWWFMNYQSSIAYKYSHLITIFIGILLAVSIASIMTGVWKASFQWKFLSIAMALVWLAPFLLYMLSLASPLFYIRFT